MRIHKFLSAAIVMIIFGALLAACGGTTPAAAPTTAPAAEPTAAPAAEPTAAAPAASGTPDKATSLIPIVPPVYRTKTPGPSAPK